MNYIDIHSHILPGLDDGAKTMEKSLEMLQIAREEGINRVILTPHNMPGKGCTARDVLEARISELRDKVKMAGIDIELYLGTEYFYRQEVCELLEHGEAVTLAGSKYVLLEFYPGEETSYIFNTVREVYSRGYKPVIAHVERYEHLIKNRNDIKALKEMGALLQVNASYVVGDYGHWRKWQVNRLLKERLVDFIATDAHSVGKRAPRLKKCARYLYKKYGTEYAEALLFGNAERCFLTE